MFDTNEQGVDRVVITFIGSVSRPKSTVDEVSSDNAEKLTGARVGDFLKPCGDSATATCIGWFPISVVEILGDNLGFCLGDTVTSTCTGSWSFTLDDLLGDPPSSNLVGDALGDNVIEIDTASGSLVSATIDLLLEGSVS